ncbi:MAG: transposase [Pseudomonadota bacterium]
MTRTHGRCRKGQRLRGKTPYGHWKTMTFVAGLRLDGIIAPMVLDCPMNGDIFASYAAQALARELWHGDILIMDNLGSHKRQQARKAIEACGAQILFLPPLQPRHGSNRTAVLKDQDTAAKSRQTICRRCLEVHRQNHRRHLSDGMRKIHPQSWICVNQIKKWSKCRVP